MKNLKYHAANLITCSNLPSNFIKISQVGYVHVANLATNISNVCHQLESLGALSPYLGQFHALHYCTFFAASCLHVNGITSR